ncbi:hypothetical protein WSM22_07620 [Cytophagales bacterium WSM2-2]|nr:hypothetical protein WSM22_07620 [Cytophagales bacterium WSM2-2]
MNSEISSERLLLNKVSLSDVDFIFELVNTPGWIRFIGDRNVKSNEDARILVERVIHNPNVDYWVVKAKNQRNSLGIISFVKRDYLEFFDLGFAFLPNHTRQGYAREAAVAFLRHSIKDYPYPNILATTVKDNIDSIALLKKLGFRFDREIEADNEQLFLYSISIDKCLIDVLVTSFFAAFSNIDSRKPDLQILNELCLPEVMIIKKSGAQEEIYNLQTFVEPRKKILTDGSLTNFTERETHEETKITGGLAQRFSAYQKSGQQNGVPFKQNGTKLFQFVKSKQVWKISSVIWEDHQV